MACMPNSLELAVGKAKEGDPSAFECLYNAYKHFVYSLCLRRTRDICDAEDLTQEVFLQVFRKVDSFRGEAAFGSWLYRVTMNTILMHARKRRIEIRFLEFPSVGEVLPNALHFSCGRDSEAVDRIALARAIASLPKVRQSLVLLHDLRGFTHREIANHLGLSVNTSKSEVFRAHRKLKQTLRGTPQPDTRRMAAAPHEPEVWHAAG